MTDGLARQTARGFAWMSGGLAGQVVLQLITLAVLARRIAPAEFGIVGAALIAVSAVQILAESGLGPAIIQHPDLRQEHIRVGFTLSAALGVASYVLLTATAPAVEAFFGDMDGLTDVLRLVALAFLIRNLTVGDFLLLRQLRFRALALVELTGYGIGHGLVAITLAVQGYGVWAIAIGHVVQQVVRTGLVAALAPHSVRPLLAPSAARELLGYGGGHTLAKAANWLARQGDNFVVGRMLGPAALGLYTKAYQLMTMPANLFGKAADNVLFPSMAAVQHDHERLRRAYLRSVGLIALLALPVSAVAATMSRELILVLLGDDWLPLKAAFDVMVFGILFRTSYKLSDSLVRAMGAVYRRAWRQGVYAGLVIGGAWIGQQAGIEGVAVAVLVAVTVNFALMAHLSVRLVDSGWRQFGLAHVPGALLAAVMAGASLPAGIVLRVWDAPPIVVLGGGLTAALLAAVAAARVAPYISPARLLAERLADLQRLLPGRAAGALRRVLGPGYRRPDPLQVGP